LEGETGLVVRRPNTSADAGTAGAGDRRQIVVSASVSARGELFCGRGVWA
jgi:hypothetical protein